MGSKEQKNFHRFSYKSKNSKIQVEIIKRKEITMKIYMNS
jgi:hypothetical protein